MHCTGNSCGPQHSSIWSVFSTNTIMALGLAHAAFCHLIMGANMQALERKHGRWRLSKIPPMFPMVPLCIKVTWAQAASLQVHTVFPCKTKAVHVSSTHLAFLFDKWKELLNTCSKFDKLLNSIEQPQLFQVQQHCANEWEEFPAHKALHLSCQARKQNELFPSNLTPEGSATCCISLFSKTWDAHVQKWIHVCLSRTTALLHCASMMQLSSPKMTQKSSVCCSNSKTSSTTFCMTRCFHHTLEFNSRIHLIDASNCHSHTSSHLQLTSWVSVMPTHVPLQLHPHSSSTWILCHLTKASIVNQLWTFHCALGTTLTLSALVQSTLAFAVACVLIKFTVMLSRRLDII